MPGGAARRGPTVVSLFRALLNQLDGCHLDTRLALRFDRPGGFRPPAPR